MIARPRAAARPRGDESGSLPMHCFDAANEVPSARGAEGIEP